MNYFGLVISTFPSTFSHHSPQPEIQFQLLGTKAIPEVGLLPAGFHPLPSDRPWHLPTLHRAASMGSLAVPSNRGVGQPPACLRPRDTMHPKTYGLMVGCDHGLQCRLEWPGQERDGVGQGVGSAEGQVQQSPCCRLWATGQRWYLTDFPTPRSGFPCCTQAGDAQ